MYEKCLVPAILTFVLVLTAGPVRAELVGHWRLDESGGTVAADDSGNGNDGTLQGGPQWVAGQVGGALEFDGVDDYVDCGNDPIFDITEQITLAVWVNASDMLNGQHNPWLGKGDNTYAIKHQSNNNLEFFVYDGAWHSTQYATDLASLNGEWHHMAGTFDGAELKFYLDGEEAATLTFAGTIGTAAHSVTLGNNSQASGRFFDGMLDDARIYNEALPAEEIQALMQPEAIPHAMGPKPANGSIHDDTKATLEWRAGAFANSHNVYFGETFDEVDQGLVEAISITAASLNTNDISAYAGGLTPGQIYYWRVDEVNDLNPESPWTGAVWSFRVRPLTAWNPTPADGVLYVHPDQEFTWEYGLDYIFHKVFFGETFEGVESAAGMGYMTLTPTYAPPPLEIGKTYYWRVDEFTGAVEHRGDIWSFTTLPEVAVTDPDLLGWWTLDEGMGATAVDWSGHGHHGRIRGGAQWTYGVHGGALYLAGGANVEIPALNVETNTVTMTAWVKRDGSQADWAGILFSREGSAVSGMGFGPANELRYHWTGQYWDFVTGIFPPAQEWFFTALVVEPTQGTLYYNGTGTSATNAETHDPDPFDGALRIGQDSQGGRDLKGTVDDVRFYNKALSAAELMEVMRGDPLLAWDPSPAPDAVMDIRDVSSLRWSAGDTATSHDVYLGASREAVAVADKDSAEFRGNQAATSFSLGDLVEIGGGDYYWRIDEVEGDTATVHTGYVWKFTVPPYLIVDDFERYTDNFEAGEAIWQAWIDGLEDPQNGGSQVGYTDAPFAETRIVHGGAQSMPLQYDNTTGPGYSEADLTFAPAQDWTVEGITTLVVHFRGAPDNAGQLYVKVNGTETPYDGDPADIATAKWFAWNIDLASVGVNLTNVTTLTIGVEGGQTGTVYIDDIWLTRP